MIGSKHSADCESPTFSSYADLWLDSVAARLKETSCAKYKNMIERYLKPYFRRRAIVEIEAGDVAQFAQTLAQSAESNATLSGSTRAAILATLRRILNAARSELSLPQIEVKGLNPSRVRRRSVDVLNAREQKKLRAFLVAEIANPAALGVFLALNLGLRIGEVCALTWGDVDFEAQTLSVSRTMTRVQNFAAARGQKKTKIRITEPKTATSVRVVPLAREALALLAPLRAESDAFLLTGRVDDFVEPRTLENQFKRILKSVGLRKVKFHAFRHTFATRWIEYNLDVKSLSEILGHSNVETTMALYVHPSIEAKRKNLNSLNRKLYGN